MCQAEPLLKSTILQNCMGWFGPHFNQKIINPIQNVLQSFVTPKDVQRVLECIKQINEFIQQARPTTDAAQLVESLLRRNPILAQILKHALVLFRKDCAARTEELLARTFHLELGSTLEEEVKALDTLTTLDWFQAIPPFPLPRLTDYLSIEFIEELSKDRIPPPRMYDEKFHILQAPTLFLKDLAYFREKCETRGKEIAIAFLDIDKFRDFNTNHMETKVDRNLLPRFMSAIEAHVYHHGYAYRQGGDEYLVLLPSLDKELAIALLDKLRLKLAALKYPDIEGATTVSIGVCIAEPDCPLTDRELRERANLAKNFAKKNGRNCIATYTGSRLSPTELGVVKP